MKTEPDVFSILDLKNNKSTLWEGVRNYQARNFMLHEMSVGDQVLLYHSSAQPPWETGVAGIAEVIGPAEADPLQFDPKSVYFDSKSTHEKPRWSCVRVGFKKEFKRTFTLASIKANKNLSKMLVIRRGQRLSIQPVEEKDYFEVLKHVK